MRTHWELGWFFRLRPRLVEGAVAAWVLACAPVVLAQSLLEGATVPAAGVERFYIGTYNAGGSVGIYHSTLDMDTGTTISAKVARSATDPSFLALHPTRKFLYAVNESGGQVAAYSINPTNASLVLLNQQSSSGGAPCHLVVDDTGRSVLVANYSGGSVTVLPIGADGKLGKSTAHIQHPGASPHAHCVTLDAGNRFALVCDLGLNRVYSYRFDSALGTLTTNTTPFVTVPAKDLGPRHLAFAPGYRRAYVICETSSSIVAFNYDSTNGVLSSFQSVRTLPANFTGANTCAEIAVHPSGKFVYGSNRGHNSVAVFGVHAATGMLTLVQHLATGSTPRHFAIDPTGAFCLVASQAGNSVVVHAIDPQTGLLTPVGLKVGVASPVCVLPYIIQPPEPVLSIQTGEANTFRLGIGHAANVLTYQLHHAADLSPASTWELLSTGSPGQTSFVLTNSPPRGFLRASVLTNY